MRPPDDFFRYVAATPESDGWGAVVTGGGRFTALPRKAYPPTGHPLDHNFTWESGRVLGAFQVVYLAEGRGEFESRATGCVDVEAGSAMLLFPGTWHRYRPFADTGWVEEWVEIGGPLLDGMLRRRTFSQDEPVISVSRRLDLEARIGSIHGLITTHSAGDAPELAAHALGLLALLHASRHGVGPPRTVVSAVAQAKRAMEEAGNSPVSMPKLAQSLGVAYSHFRREFRVRTGISPRQYLLRIRMQRAQRLLGASDESLKQIADRLGFSSAYHLSSAFKAEFGMAPSHWRRRKLER